MDPVRIANSSNPTSLYVDLDGTLTSSDLLLESLVLLLKRNLLFVLALPFWLFHGRANLKYQIARRVDLRADLLPYNTQVLDYLNQQSRQGREIVLISASNERLVKIVAGHLALFSRALGSSRHINLKGQVKLDAIEQDCKGGFDYLADHKADLPVWQKAKGALVVSRHQSLIKLVANTARLEKVFDKPPPTIDYFKAMRPHQWLKNTLVLLPLALSHEILNATLLLQAVLAFVSFSLCASSVYLLNDMLDLPHDRQHPTKRQRPFASGKISLMFGLIASPLLLILSFALAALLPVEFIAVLATYYLATCLYNFYLKAQVLVDVLTLASLYTLRIIAGAAAISVIPTFWLLAFSMFLFLSLAVVKRYTELDLINTITDSRQQAQGRGYIAGDLQLLLVLGVTSGLMAVLVFALYINSDDIQMLYGTPQVLWFICPLLLYMAGRIWILTHRGEMHEDPVIYAITDRRSQFVVLLCAVLVWAATTAW
ncbi:MAG: UbiA family prenyltransferase [Pseudohongiellaceae bacterium]